MLTIEFPELTCESKVESKALLRGDAPLPYSVLDTECPPQSSQERPNLCSSFPGVVYVAALEACQRPSPPFMRQPRQNPIHQQPVFPTLQLSEH